MRKGPDVFGMMFQSCREVVSHTSITTPTFSWERHLPFSLMMLLTVFAYAGCAPAALIRRRPGVRPRARLRGSRESSRRITVISTSKPPVDTRSDSNQPNVQHPGEHRSRLRLSGVLRRRSRSELSERNVGAAPAEVIAPCGSSRHHGRTEPN